jgi:hypothetical protein
MKRRRPFLFALFTSIASVDGECRIIMEKNEWAAGCIPAVNFVVKLVDCGDGVAM